MIIRFKKQANQAEIETLRNWLTEKGYEQVYTGHSLVIPKLHDASIFAGSSFIEEVIPVETPFQLASKQYKERTSFAVNGIAVGQGDFNLIGGPCSIESEEQIFATAAFLQQCGVRFIRGGAYKPRTSPYSFRGLGEDGLKLISKAAKKHNLAVVTELLDLSFLDKVMEYADVIQVGSRNMDNYHLLHELGKVNKPVLLKRGMSSRVYEWLLAADYILSGGNEKVILCERGIRSFDPAMRNVMDVAAIPLLKSLSHLPVFADPSHGTGASRFVSDLALASTIAGADGLLIEIHPDPSQALSDGHQALKFEEFRSMQNKLVQLLQMMNKSADFMQNPEFFKTQTL